MHDNNKYKELVFYLEACESGSMFNNLIPSNWNIYVTTASNPFESSYACFYDNTYRAYLDDCYSINWMNNTETNNAWSLTLQKQFENVKQTTTQSHVCQYGDLSFTNEVVGMFQGKKASLNKGNRVALPALKKGDVVSSRDVKGTTIRRVLQEENLSPADKNQYEKFLAEHEALSLRADVVWGAFSNKLNLKPIAQDFATVDDKCHSAMALDVECMKGAVNAATKHCGMFTEESIKYASKLRDACDAGYSVAEISSNLEKICSIVAH